MLELSGIDSFYGKAHILHELSFGVARGEVVALLGRNGAGKTTAIKSVMQMVVPRTGRVMFDGRDVTGLAPYKVARLGIGYVPEERRIFSDLSVLENLEVGRQPARDGAYVWRREELFELFPNLAERRHNRGRQLSGGEQQMLSIARTLMGNPTLLLLDEPSEGIAPVIVEQMAHTIRRIKQEGVAVVLCEQNLTFARQVTDRAVVLESGVKRFDGGLAELDRDDALKQDYLSV